MLEGGDGDEAKESGDSFGLPPNEAAIANSYPNVDAAGRRKPDDKTGFLLGASEGMSGSTRAGG